MFTFRVLHALAFAAPFLAVGCSFLAPDLSSPTSADTTPAGIVAGTNVADFASTAVPKHSAIAASPQDSSRALGPSSATCASVKTPLPTPTPGANLPAPAPIPTAAAFPAQTGRSQLRVTRFDSESIAQEMPITIYLPPGYFDSGRRYPVLYMLSGFAGDPLEWVDYGLCDSMELLVRGGYIQPMIVVMPSGDYSWWFNHAAVPDSDGKAWGDYIWKDIVGYTDGNYRTLAKRESRAIGGLSAGGQGAMMFSLTHPELFRVVGAHSPSLRHADGSLPFFGDEAYFNQYDPLWLFKNTTGWQGSTYWIDVGDDDTEWGDSIRDLHVLLTLLGVPHTFQDTWHGVHDGYYWGAHVGDYLTWYASQLVGQEPQP